MLARKAVTLVNVSTVPVTWRSPVVYGDIRTTNHFSPSRKSARDSTPLAMTWPHCSSKRGKPASTAISRDARPMSDGERRSTRSEEHTSELQSQSNLVCRLLLEKKKNNET